MSTELYHWGVKGMRWGVRKSEDELAREEDTNRLKLNLKSEYKRAKLKDDTALKKAQLKNDLEKFKMESSERIKKEKIESENLKTKSEALIRRRKIGLAFALTAIAAYGTYKMAKLLSEARTSRLIASGRNAAKLELAKQGKGFAVNNHHMPTTINVSQVDSGFHMFGGGNKVMFKNSFNKMRHSATLYHSGIKGMKWGVRRYQNEDGTLTEAGKARYNDDGTKKDSRDMTTRDLEVSSERLVKERNYNALSGNAMRNVSKKDTAVKVGASAVASALAVGGAVLIKDLIKYSIAKKQNGQLMSPENERAMRRHSIKKAAFVGSLAAGAAIVSTLATQYGGRIVNKGEIIDPDSIK